MDISVVVEKVADNGYQATSYVPTHVVAQGRTRQEALDRLSDQLRGRLSSAEVVTLSIPLLGDAHPWKAIAGSWRASPDRAEMWIRSTVRPGPVGQRELEEAMSP